MNLSLNQTLLTFLFYVRQTWVTQLILAINDSSTYMHGLAVYMREGLPLARDSYDHLRDVLWEDIFKLSASAAASEFCE